MYTSRCREIPVEAAAVSEKYLLLLQKVEDKFLVVGDMEAGCVDSREDIESRLRFDNAHAGNGIDGIADEFALFVDSSAGNEQFSGSIGVFESNGNERLRGNIGAEAHGGKQIDALDVAADMRFFSAQRHPAAAVAGNEVRFGQTVESHREYIGGDGGNGRVLQTVHHKAVVYFIGEYNEVVLAGNLGDLEA